MKQAHDPLLIPEAKQFMMQTLNHINLDEVCNLQHQHLDQAWRAWLSASSYNTVHGLDQFSHSCFCAGTTPVFGEFISRHSKQRLRVSRSDFVLSKILARTYHRSMQWLEEEPLKHNDCLIISLPFSGNGSWYPGFQELLYHADDLGVPVFIDAAYFGISHGIEYPLNHACVTDFATSLSKHLANGNAFRMGIRFTRTSIDDGLSAALLGSNVFDRLNAYISIQLLNNFSHDWIIRKYKVASEGICHNNLLEPTNTITIGLGGQTHVHMKRGDYIRVCISEELSRISVNS